MDRYLGPPITPFEFEILLEIANASGKTTRKGDIKLRAYGARCAKGAGLHAMIFLKCRNLKTNKPQWHQQVMLPP